MKTTQLKISCLLILGAMFLLFSAGASAQTNTAKITKSGENKFVDLDTESAGVKLKFQAFLQKSKQIRGKTNKDGEWVEDPIFKELQEKVKTLRTKRESEVEAFKTERTNFRNLFILATLKDADQKNAQDLVDSMKDNEDASIISKAWGMIKATGKIFGRNLATLFNLTITGIQNFALESIFSNYEVAAKYLNDEVDKMDIDADKKAPLRASVDKLLKKGAEIRNIERGIESYKGLDSGEVYEYKDGDTTIYYVINGDSLVTVGGVTSGCTPLPAKLLESQSCIFCPLFATIFSAAQTMATQSYNALATDLSVVVLIGFAIYIAFEVLKNVSSLSKQEATKFVSGLLVQAFKVLIAFYFLMDASHVYGYIIGPVLGAGLEFGTGLLFNASGQGVAESAMAAAKACGQTPISVADGVLPQYLYVKLECFIKSVQVELALPQSIGSSLMCVARKVGKIDVGPLKDFLWDFGMMFQGLIIWVFAWLVSLAFAFYLIDATIRLGIVGALMPFLIACWPFKATSSYTSKGWTIFMNTFFTYVFMGLVITVNVTLMGQSLTGGKGGLSELRDYINGDDIEKLKEVLDIGVGGFLVLIACCIFGFKLTAESSSLASNMAGGGGGAGIGANIGGLAANVTKRTAMKGLKVAGQGVSKLDDVSGFKGKRQEWGQAAKNKVQNAIWGGGSGGGKGGSSGGSGTPGGGTPDGGGAPRPSGSNPNQPPVQQQQQQQQRQQQQQPNPNTQQQAQEAENAPPRNDGNGNGSNNGNSFRDNLSEQDKKSYNKAEQFVNRGTANGSISQPKNQKEKDDMVKDVFDKVKGAEAKGISNSNMQGDGYSYKTDEIGGVDHNQGMSVDANKLNPQDKALHNAIADRKAKGGSDAGLDVDGTFILAKNFETRGGDASVFTRSSDS